MNEDTKVYVVVVESDDGYTSTNQGVYRKREDAEKEADNIERATGDAVVVETHDLH